MKNAIFFKEQLPGILEDGEKNIPLLHVPPIPNNLKERILNDEGIKWTYSQYKPVSWL